MATHLRHNADQFEIEPAQSRPKLGHGLTKLLAPLASLKLTVVLLAMATFIVLAGTLAQASVGIERAVDEYFRVRPWGSTLGFAWIPFQVFLPESFFPSRPQLPGGFWFPGGWLIGLVMFVNLIAAHSLRFTVQAKGVRLVAGLATIIIGIGVTAAVVVSGSGFGGLQATPLLGFDLLWRGFQVIITLAAAGHLATTLWMHFSPSAAGTDRRLVWIVTAALPISLGLGVWTLLVGEVSGSSMRILWQLIKGTVAGLVLLAGCWLVFRKRAGVVLLHAGIAMLMISELMTGLLALETRMTLTEGETANWAFDINTVELAVTDKSDPQHNTVTRIPASRLEAGQTIAHKSLPFKIRIDEYYRNAAVVEAPVMAAQKANAGFGRQLFAREVPEAAGASASGGADMPAAYATLLDPKTDKPLGKYLLSTQLASVNLADTVTVGDAIRTIELRFRRDYKPYAVTLSDVQKNDYVGTDTPRDYRSKVQVVSESLGADFTRDIWMNNPLRFAGETLYQSGYHRDKLGRESTTLQIVRNTGWMLPYVSCMLVAVGMLSHFLVTLNRFLGRRSERRAAKEDTNTAAATPRAARGWVIPVIVAALFAAWLGSKWAPPKTPLGEADLTAFGQLPVASAGRVKPIDSLARESLKALSGNRQTWLTGKKYGPWNMFSEKKPAVEWLLDFVADPATGGKHQVIRIENDELRDVLELPVEREKFLYSVSEVLKALPALDKRVNEVREKSRADKELTAGDRAALELERQIGVLDLLMRSFQPNPQELFIDGVGQLGIDAYLKRYETLKFGDMNAMPPIPSRNPPLAVYHDGTWETLAHVRLIEIVDAVRMGNVTPEPSEETALWEKMLSSWRENKVDDFNAAVSRYRTFVGKQDAAGYDPAKVRFETQFNHAAPFYYMMIPYVLAALLAAASWLGWSRPLNNTAFALVAMTFVLHTAALAGRIYISGRPPVTNLYSSAVFIGWAAVAFGMLMERMFNLGFGNVLAGTIGFAALLIAHNLSADGDTFTVLQAVLDTQFWLATHVVCITLGYAATYAAGFLGLMYIVTGWTTTRLNRIPDGQTQTVGQSLVRMCYGTLCFAILFSFVGTVLGGLWADDSWGRFWGWDPKENGALIIVLWNALVLHARWGAMVKDRGLAALTVAGNIAVSWSWFGTNELGVGLHSYGFTDGVLLALGLFVASQIAVMTLGMLPKAWWPSFRGAA